MGSASSLIAYEEAHIKYVGFEIDGKRFGDSFRRLKEYRSQANLFDLYPEIIPENSEEQP